MNSQEEEFDSYDNEMEDDDDDFDETEEEDILVYVEFEGTSESNIFCNEKLQLDMIGLDLEHPIMQINGKHYEGTYEDDVGTSLLFEKDPNAVVEDPVFDQPNNLKYFGKVDKILKMKRIFVKPRLEVLGDSEHPSCVPNIKTIQDFGIPPGYQENALKLWTEKRNERMNAMDEYLAKQKKREEKRKQGIELDSESDDDMPYAAFDIENLNNSQIDLQTISNNKKTKAGNNDKNADDNQGLTVIDPGPSTSRDSVPWINPKKEINSDSDGETLKHHGHIEVVPIRKFYRKKSRQSNGENQDEIDENEATEILNRDPNDVVASCLLAHDETPMDEDTPINDNDNNDDNKNDDTDVNEEGVNHSESSDKLEENVEDKKTEKEKKREAKMKEITDRLKKKAQNEKIISET